MADNIRVVDSELQACVAAYRNSLDVLQTAVRTYEAAMNALRSDWTGKAFVIMIAKVVDLVNKIKASFERVNDAISELQAVENLFEENESKLKGNFDALDAGSQSPFGG
ncbi:MAG: hypothetical protein J6K55_03700 [Clostridia bacterium]|nr:hypothetical protein [Clostridia bacterium]MBR6668671.1 hypothetical protein [Clostridia bacterium]